MSISGNFVGSYSQIGKTFILTDENGNEVTAVVTDQEQIFTATDNDVRFGCVYAGDSGVSTGTKVIPHYKTAEGYTMCLTGKEVTISFGDVEMYDYTKLQAIICPLNVSEKNSVSAEKVVINDNLYEVKTTNSLSTLTKNHDTKKIEFCITNDSTSHWLIRYFTYKEIE